MRKIIISALFVVLGLQASGAKALDYPTKTIRIVIPFPAGGPVDMYARFIGHRLQKAWGKPVIVESVVGGTGAIGTKQVARAVPDGHTLLFTSNSSHVISPLLQEKPQFDNLKDFAAVSMLLQYPFCLMVANDVPATTAKELIEYSAANPGKLNFGSIGPGSGNHLAAELFNARAGLKAVHVPYRGIAAMQQGLMGGDIQFMFDSIGASRGLVEAGKYRAVAITGRARSKGAPELPTLAESGLPDIDALVWFGLFAPAGTPPAVIDAIQKQIGEAVREGELRERIIADGAEPLGSEPGFLVERIRTETPQWLELIDHAGLRGK